jgi:hypothetical protein
LEKYVRYPLILILCFLVLSPQAHACLGPDSWHNLFFETIPNPQPDADLIAIISVSDKKEPRGGVVMTAMATVIQVIKTSDARVKQGEKIPMQLENTSCGPDPLIGSKGTIIAKLRTDSKNRLVLHPYTHTNYKNLITPPALLPDGFDGSPKPLRVGEDIPKSFAVILIGVVGAESVDYLSLNHSTRPGIDTTFPAKSNAIVAISIPVGIKQLSISQVTIGRRRAGYRPNDTVGVNAPKLNIDQPGLYYIATLDTNNPGQFQKNPRPDQLKQFRANYRYTIGSLDPINFKWPSQ